MGKIDTWTTEYLRNRDVFADLVNIALYHGERRICPDKLVEADTVYKEMVYEIGKKEYKKRQLQEYRDLLKEFVGFIDGNQVYVSIGVESQAAIDYAMPIRVFIYNALQLLRQLKQAQCNYRVQERAKKGKRKAKQDTNAKSHRVRPLLSTVPKGTLFNAIVTIVVYWGEKPWDGPTTLHECLKPFDPALCALIPDYPLVIIEPRRLASDLVAGMQSELKTVFECMQLAHDARALDLFVHTDSRFKDIDSQAAALINEVLDLKISVNTKKKRFNMCTAWKTLLENARNEGIASITPELQKLRDENATLKTDYASMKTDYASMKTDYASMKTENEAVKRNLRAKGWSEEQIQALFVLAT